MGVETTAIVAKLVEPIREWKWNKNGLQQGQAWMRLREKAGSVPNRHSVCNDRWRPVFGKRDKRTQTAFRRVVLGRRTCMSRRRWPFWRECPDGCLRVPLPEDVCPSDPSKISGRVNGRQMRAAYYIIISMNVMDDRYVQRETTRGLAILICVGWLQAVPIADCTRGWESQWKGHSTYTRWIQYQNLGIEMLVRRYRWWVITRIWCLTKQITRPVMAQEVCRIVERHYRMNIWVTMRRLFLSSSY